MEALFTCRLTPLDKNPEVPPICVGEIMKKVAGKIVIAAIRNDIIVGIGALQVCTWHDAGGEIVHSMRSFYNEEKTKALLLVDVENAINAVNRKAFYITYNLSFGCHLRAQFLF